MGNVVRIRRLGFINCYLVDEGDTLTVIDTAMSGADKKLVSAAAERGKPITRIVLTHAHADHVGCLDRLARAAPDAEILISERDARFLAGNREFDEDEEPKKLRGNFKDCEAKPTGTLADGDMVGSLRVIETPGHSPGHVSLLDTRDNTLFGGDVFSTWAGMATSSVVNPLFPLVHMGTWNEALNLESARKLFELRPTKLAPGHGRVADNPTSDMGLVIEKAAQMLAKKRR